MASAVLGLAPLAPLPHSEPGTPLDAIAPSAPAEAAGSQTINVQLTYTCQVAGVPDRASIGILVNAEAPASVSPGEQVYVSGSMTLRLPENVRAVANYVNITAVEGYSDTVTLPITINGNTTVMLADRVLAPRVGVGNPMVVGASLTMPPITVPEDATGEIVVEGPANDTVSSPRPDLGPAMVAFTAMATVYNQEGSQSIGLFCWDDAGIDRTLARIPVTPAAATADPAATQAPAAQAAAPQLEQTVVPQKAAPKVAAAKSGEAESEAKDNAKTFRVAAAKESSGAHTAEIVRNVTIGVGVIFVLASLSALLGWRRLRAVRRARRA